MIIKNPASALPTQRRNLGLMTKFPDLIINPYFTILFYGKKGVIFMTSFVRTRGKTWSYYFEIELNGKRRQISKGGFAKKSDAKSAMAEAIVDYEQRNFLNISKVRLDRFFKDWLENTVRPLRSRTTYLRYQSLYDIYIRPEIGGELLTSITPIKADRKQRCSMCTAYCGRYCTVPPSSA